MNKHGSSGESSASPALPVAQAQIELRPVDNSDRPVLANFAAVQASSGLVYLDFGFLDLQAMNTLSRLVSGTADAPASIRGKLACRVALPADTVANLARQLNQLLVHPPEEMGRPEQPENSLH